MTTTNNIEITHYPPSNPVEPDVILNDALNIIDTAIAGMLVHDMGADTDYTLNVSADPEEWKYAAIKITDTGVLLTAARNIVVPVNTKQYTIINATAQDLIVKTAAGTGVAVTSGAQGIVFCDGVNVVESTASGGGGGGGGALEVSPELVTADKLLTSANGHYQLIEASVAVPIAITLPDATSISESAFSYLVTNLGNRSVNIKNDSGFILFHVATNQSVLISLTDSSTADGTWRELLNNSPAIQQLDDGLSIPTSISSEEHRMWGIDDTKAALVYRKTTDNYLYAVVSELSTSNVMTQGTAVAVTSAAAWDSSVTGLGTPSPTQGLVLYRGASNYLYGRIINTSSTIVTSVGAEQTLISSSVTSKAHIVKGISSTKAIMLYEDPLSTDDLKVVILSISGSTITMNTSATITTGTTSYEQICMLSDTKALVYYTESSIHYAAIVNISGTTVTPVTSVDVRDFTTSGTIIPAYDGLVRLSEKRAALVGALNSRVCCKLFDIDGDVITDHVVQKIGVPSASTIFSDFNAFPVNESKIFVMAGASSSLHGASISILGDAISYWDPALLDDGIVPPRMGGTVLPMTVGSDAPNRLLISKEDLFNTIVTPYELLPQSLRF